MYGIYLNNFFLDFFWYVIVMTNETPIIFVRHTTDKFLIEIMSYGWHSLCASFLFLYHFPYSFSRAFRALFFVVVVNRSGIKCMSVIFCFKFWIHLKRRHIMNIVLNYNYMFSFWVFEKETILSIEGKFHFQFHQ